MTSLTFINRQQAGHAKHKTQTRDHYEKANLSYSLPRSRFEPNVNTGVASPYSSRACSPTPEKVSLNRERHRAIRHASAENAPEMDRSGELVIGDEVLVRTEDLLCESLIVQGTLLAKAECDILKVGNSGAVLGEVTANDVNIHGRLEGDLTVNGGLYIHSTGQVSGAIRFQELTIDRGGLISGDVQHLRDEKVCATSSFDDSETTPTTIQGPSTVFEAIMNECKARDAERRKVEPKAKPVCDLGGLTHSESKGQNIPNNQPKKTQGINKKDR
jgi:cytoskeletal protein CcmA (bactofilin family)